MLEHLAAILVVVKGAVTGAAATVKLATSAANFFSTRSRSEQQASAALALLGLRAEGSRSYRHDSVHSLFDGDRSLHPDNLSALATLAGYDYAAAMSQGTLVVEEAPSGDADGNIVLIGSPMSEWLSRAVLGYLPDGHGVDSLGLLAPPIDLPWTWALSASDYGSRDVARRYVAGKGLSERPNWRLQGRSQLYVPQIRNGLLDDDFLLVTKMRNYVGPGGWRTGHFITSIGGAHGTGTRAVELLVRDDALLRELGSQLVGLGVCYQALFHVTDIRHDERRGSRARSIQLVGVEKISDDEFAWDTAAAIVSDNINRLGGATN